jgi:hypothetical protein
VELHRDPGAPRRRSHRPRAGLSPDPPSGVLRAAAPSPSPASRRPPTRRGSCAPLRLVWPRNKAARLRQLARRPPSTRGTHVTRPAIEVHAALPEGHGRSLHKVLSVEQRRQRDSAMPAIPNSGACLPVACRSTMDRAERAGIASRPEGA